jgi:hypothetical protein
VVSEYDGCCSNAAGSAAQAQPSARVPLSQLRNGDCATVCECALQGRDGALLRAMGLCPNAHVRMCRGGGRMIVAVGSAGAPAAGESRIGLDRELAEQILVAPTR